MTNQTTNHAFLFTPIDVLFCRTGRPYGAGQTAVSELPSPQVLAGAIRTALLREAQALPDSGKQIDGATHNALNAVRIHGPLLHSSEHGLLVPVPADLAWDRKKDPAATEQPHLVRLRPLIDSHWQLDGGRYPLWGSQATDIRTDWQAVTGYLMKATALKNYLHGGTVHQDMLVETTTLYSLETRTHVGIDPKTKTAEDGKLFVQKVIRFAHGVSLYAEIDYDTQRWEHGIGTSITLGGDRHQCTVEPISMHDWHTAPNDQERTLVYHLSPCLFPSPHTHAPEWNTKLVSAAVSGHVAVSGWDYRSQRPKPTRHAIVAGSVHFLKNTQPSSEASGSPDGQCAGFGWPLLGTWEPWKAH